MIKINIKKSLKLEIQLMPGIVKVLERNLELYIHPIDPGKHSKAAIINVASCKLAAESGNIDIAF